MECVGIGERNEDRLVLVLFLLMEVWMMDGNWFGGMLGNKGGEERGEENEENGRIE